MVKLLSFRYHQPVSSEHETFEKAAIAAIYEVEFNSAYPREIRDGDRVLWQRSQEGLVPLQRIAIEAGHGGFLGFD